MSVYTSVNIKELKIWLQDYALDNLTDYQGIKSGITNTNYFLMTAHDRFVLTLFEKNTLEDLPYFVDLMAHLAKNSFLCPKPIFKKQRFYVRSPRWKFIRHCKSKVIRYCSHKYKGG